MTLVMGSGFSAVAQGDARGGGLVDTETRKEHL